MAVTVIKKPYKGWKNCIEVTNGIIDFVATTDIGPRIIRFGFVGKENEFCEVEEQLGTTGGNEWKIYGGHRLWHSPEAKPRTYEPDNFHVKWKKVRNGIKLIQDMEPWTMMQKEMEITMSPDKAEVNVLHRIINIGPWPVEFSVWSLTVLATGGKEIMPQIQGGEPLLPNRMLSLWPYTKLNDHRVYWGEKYIMLQQDKNMKPPFKIGFPNADGWAAYANHGHLFIKQYKHTEGVPYPDFGASSYETYTTDFMLEMETLSPLKMVESGGTIEHSEVWKLFDDVKIPKTEEDIDKDILPFI